MFRGKEANKTTDCKEKDKKVEEKSTKSDPDIIVEKEVWFIEAQLQFSYVSLRPLRIPFNWKTGRKLTQWHKYHEEESGPWAETISSEIQEIESNTTNQK